MLGVVLLVLAGGAIWAAQSWEVPFAADPLGPRGFPSAVAVVLGACGLLLLIARGATFEWPERKLAPLLLVVAMVAYALVLETLGFLIGTALLAVAVALLFGARPLPALLTGAATSVALWALFDRLLDLPLPKGLLGA
ncbi:tripartite tricarboxylate transporter TctB family protein [Roseococcus sp. YIM B11640]|uniref:tripartite tricarboxylate transporter TctB family protein n=1 Tax=Roseococcus sp. YIM B11640 TaxID=3133973 RepID=UPI003C7B030A